MDKPMADSCRCLVEVSAILKAIILPLIIKKKKQWINIFKGEGEIEKDLVKIYISKGIIL